MREFPTFKELLSPSHWSYKTYLFMGLFLLGINLFGPRGLIYWSLLRQQNQRVSRLNLESQKQISELETQMAQFKKFPYQQEKAIREELGYLKPDEFSLEFVEGPQRIANKSEKRTDNP